MINYNSFELTEEEQKQKIIILQDMKCELEKLEYQSKHYHRVNIELYTLRVLRVIMYSIKRFYPYILSAGLTFLIFKTIHFTPFVQDEIDKKQRIQKTFDGKGNIQYEMQYQDFDNNHNRIELVGKWEKVNDKYYEREIKVYENNRITVNKIKELIEKQDLSLNRVFGEPVLIKKEKRNNLSLEEIDSLPFSRAIIYSTSSDEAIIVKESKSLNIVTLLLWIFVNVLIDEFIRLSRKKDFDSLMDYIHEINQEYKIINPEELNQLVKIKRSNYERLTR